MNEFKIALSKVKDEVKTLVKGIKDKNRMGPQSDDITWDESHACQALKNQGLYFPWITPYEAFVRVLWDLFSLSEPPSRLKSALSWQTCLRSETLRDGPLRGSALTLTVDKVTKLTISIDQSEVDLSIYPGFPAVVSICEAHNVTGASKAKFPSFQEMEKFESRLRTQRLISLDCSKVLRDDQVDVIKEAFRTLAPDEGDQTNVEKLLEYIERGPQGATHLRTRDQEKDESCLAFDSLGLRKVGMKHVEQCALCKVLLNYKDPLNAKVNSRTTESSKRRATQGRNQIMSCAEFVMNLQCRQKRA